MHFMSSHKYPSRAAGLAALLGFAAATGPLAAGPKRCDWHGPLSSGENPFIKCVDFAALNGKELNLPKNVTRIAADGLSFCASKTTTTGPGNADIVFVYDNSGSMTPDLVYINPTTKDTTFYYDNNSNGCERNPKGGTLTYKIRNGSTRTIPIITDNNNCSNNAPGDPYFARGEVIKDGIDFLAQTSPTSTAGVLSFTEEVRYPHTPVAMNNASAIAELKSTIELDEDGGTFYGPPLQRAQEWLSNPSYVKTERQIIVFISDGAPKDGSGRNDYHNQVTDETPPIYSIYLSRAATPDTANLRELSDLTGGTFTRVNPNDPTAMDKVLKQIITTVTTNPGTPKSATITNKTLKPPQVSHTLGATANPDGSIGMRLDSILALDSGRNSIEIELTKDDNTTQTYSFTMNVTGNALGSTGGNYTCYDLPTLKAIDKATGTTPEVYSPIKDSYQLELVRSPSELGAVSVSASSKNNDKETIKLGAPDLTQGLPTQTGDFKYNSDKASVTSGNGILEVDDFGELTFAWSHPRDARESVTYTLPGKIIPVVSGKPEVEWLKDHLKKGGEAPVTVADAPRRIDLITTFSGKCLSNCKGTEPYHGSVKVPAMKITIRSPILYTGKVYDNFGQFVNDLNGALDSAAWNSLSKSGDSAQVLFKILPYSKNGQNLGTGAYILKLEIRALGDQVTRGADGESIVVKNARREYVSRFGYLRPGH